MDGEGRDGIGRKEGGEKHRPLVRQSPINSTRAQHTTNDKATLLRQIVTFLVDAGVPRSDAEVSVDWCLIPKQGSGDWQTPQKKGQRDGKSV
jgi:hypothetical protein